MMSKLSLERRLVVTCQDSVQLAFEISTLNRICSLKYLKEFWRNLMTTAS